jgi:hypothetical protein
MEEGSMCDPVTATMAALNVGGQLMQGRAARKQANAAAAEDDYQALLAADSAAVEARNIRRAGEQQRGQVLAGQAASGVVIGEGSALAVERQLIEDAARDEYLTILTGQRQASALQRDAGLKRRAGRDAMRSNVIGAGTSLLSTGYSYAKAAGWRSRGPGFSGTQAPAPVIYRDIRG